MLDQIHQQFIEVVRKNRGSRLHETPEIFSGLVWTGQQAVQMGLADIQLGSDLVARDVIKQETLVNYTQRDRRYQNVWQGSLARPSEQAPS